VIWVGADGPGLGACSHRQATTDEATMCPLEPADLPEVCAGLVRRFRDPDDPLAWLRLWRAVDPADAAPRLLPVPVVAGSPATSRATRSAQGGRVPEVGSKGRVKRSIVDIADRRALPLLQGCAQFAPLSHAQPGGFRQVRRREMQASPQALPLLQVRQQDRGSSAGLAGLSALDAAALCAPASRASAARSLRLQASRPVRRYNEELRLPVAHSRPRFVSFARR
jgi:hypothetical protein